MEMKLIKTNRNRLQASKSTVLALLNLICVAHLFACTPEDDIDPPQEDQCLAAPICGSNQSEVNQCDETVESCNEVSICGQTIYCADDEDDDGVSCRAAPTCGSDEVEVDACDEDDDDCYENTICDQSVFCRTNTDAEDGEDDELVCQAIPTCGPDQEEVEACQEGDESCQAVTICETTIFCADPVE